MAKGYKKGPFKPFPNGLFSDKLCPPGLCSQASKSRHLRQGTHFPRRSHSIQCQRSSHASYTLPSNIIVFYMLCSALISVWQDCGMSSYSPALQTLVGRSQRGFEGSLQSLSLVHSTGGGVGTSGFDPPPDKKIKQ